MAAKQVQFVALTWHVNTRLNNQIYLLFLVILFWLWDCLLNIYWIYTDKVCIQRTWCANLVRWMQTLSGYIQGWDLMEPLSLLGFWETDSSGKSITIAVIWITARGCLISVMQLEECRGWGGLMKSITSPLSQILKKQNCWCCIRIDRFSDAGKGLYL